MSLRARLHRPVLRWLALACLLLAPLRAAIPSTPRNGDFLHDLANILPADDAATLRQRQAEVFNATRVPIVVVTVPSIDTYASDRPDIETFARRWFDAWGIGARAPNTGILVIVSLGDRKARIELGADWGRRWDGHARKIMDSELTPRFKEGRYGAGLLDGFEALALMAAHGPDASPPRPSFVERISDSPSIVFLREANPMAQRYGPRAMLLIAGVGVMLLIAAIFVPEYRGSLIKTGLVLIGLALFFWVLVVVLIVFSRSSDDGDSYRSHGWFGGGGGSSGGGFSGGSSGGGGASGSW